MTTARADDDAGPAGAVAAVDGVLARRWLEAAARSLRTRGADVDGLNVFPVPDGDTGTNLRLTLDGAVAALGESDGLPDVLTAAARGALGSARGNSGVLLSQLVEGLARTLAGVHRADARQVAAALVAADALAWQAVDAPVAGTWLTVSRSMATAAERASTGTLEDVVLAAAAAAREALGRTPAQLEVLATAGVVDAGGAGLVLVLDALAAVVTGVEAPWLALADRAALAAVGAGQGGHEVMFVLDPPPGPDDAAAALRARLAELGSSVAVVAGRDLWSAHVHTDDPGAALAAARVVGEPRDVRVTPLDASSPPWSPGPTEARPGVAVLVVTGDDALDRLVVACGAVPLDPADPVDAARAVTAARAVGAALLLVLDPADAAGVADALAGAGVQVRARTVPDPVRLLAVLGHLAAGASPSHGQDGRDGPDGLDELAEASFAAVRVVEVPPTDPTDPVQAGLAAVAGLVDEGTGVVTVVGGTAGPGDLAERVGAEVGARWPHVDVVVVATRRPGLRLVVGAE